MNTHGIVPVEQRVVDRNGKSVFLADVEIMDVSSGEQVSKSRTNGTGKWMAALPLGNYKVTVRKLESLTREKVEAIQTIKVDGTESPLKLPMVIIK
jgi:predicted phage tail protein